MAMSLKLINNLLRANGASSIVFPLNMPEKQQTLLIPLELGQQHFLLELRQEGEQRSWTLSEEGIYPFSATALS